MFVGVGRFELRVPASGSLKTKRHAVRAVIDGLRAKFNVAVAEVDHQDLWQRAAIGVSCVSEGSFHARKMLAEIEKWVRREDRVEVLSVETDILVPGE